MNFFDRLHPELRIEIEKFPEKHYFDLQTLIHSPQQLHLARLATINSNPIPKPADIDVDDIFIKSSLDGEEIRLHIYKKVGSTNKQALIYFHGGGYLYGAPEQSDQFLFRLVSETGITIIAPCYRLAPKYQFPTPIQDGFDALLWIIDNGKKHLNIDTNNLIIYGASAGGHLAAAVCQKATDSGLKNIGLQFLLYPVITNLLSTKSMLEFADTPFWNKTYAEISWKHFLGENVNQSIRYADLFNYDKFYALPPAVIIAVELDPLRDEAINYAQTLVAHGVTTEVWLIPGAMHVFDRYKSKLTEDFFQFNLKTIANFIATL